MFKDVKAVGHEVVTKEQMMKEVNNMKRDNKKKNFVRVTIGGKRYKWYYKVFAKERIKEACCWCSYCCY